MPFGKKSIDVTKPKSDGNERRQIIVPAPAKTHQSRNLSCGPPSSAIVAKPAATQKAKRRPSVSSGDDYVGESGAVAKRSKVEQKQLDAIASPDGRKRCAECKTTETSTWRRDPVGNLICNKCGLRKRKDHKAPSRRPTSSKGKVVETDEGPKQESSTVDTAPVKVLPDLTISATPVITDPRPPRPWADSVRRGPAVAENHVSLLASPVPVPALATIATPSVATPIDSTTKAKPGSSVTQIIRMSMPAAAKVATVEDIKVVDTPVKSVTPSRRPGPKKAVNPRTMELKVCLTCGTDESPAWRKDKDGNPLCNKCMLRQKRAAERRPGQVTRRRKTTTGLSQSDLSFADVPDSTEKPNKTPLLDRDADAHQLPNGASPNPLRTESQIVYDRFTHINSRPSSFLDEDHGAPVGTQQDERPEEVKAVVSEVTETIAPVVVPSTDPASSVTSKHSLYGVPAPDKSTTMVSRADARAAAKRKSASPEMQMEKRPPAPALKVAPGWVLIDEDLDPRPRSASPGWKSRGLDLLPEVKRKKRTSLVASENGSADSNDSRDNLHKAPYREGGPCARCSTVHTPLWRKNSQGQDICNKCGIQEKRVQRKSTGIRTKKERTPRGPSGPSPLVLRTHKKTGSGTSATDATATSTLSSHATGPVATDTVIQDAQDGPSQFATNMGPSSPPSHESHDPTPSIVKSKDFWSSVITPTDISPSNLTATGLSTSPMPTSTSTPSIPTKKKKVVRDRGRGQ